MHLLHKTHYRNYIIKLHCSTGYVFKQIECYQIRYPRVRVLLTRGLDRNSWLAKMGHQFSQSVKDLSSSLNFNQYCIDLFQTIVGHMCGTATHTV